MIFQTGADASIISSHARCGGTVALAGEMTAFAIVEVRLFTAPGIGVVEAEGMGKVVRGREKLSPRLGKVELL